jgi:hypothetical protein
MGGNGAGELSATCYYWGLELQMTQKVPIGLIHSSYGGSAVEDWISKETLGDGKSGKCPGAITKSAYSDKQMKDAQEGNRAFHPWLGSKQFCMYSMGLGMGVPSQQWNGQLVPLLNTTIKGAIPQCCDPAHYRPALSFFIR